MTAPNDLARFEVGEQVIDSRGVVWEVCRDGGMAQRTKWDSPTGVESAGIAWLSRAHGPLRSLASVVSRRDTDLRTRIEAIHKRDATDTGYCVGDGFVWPCPTSRTLDGDTREGDWRDELNRVTPEDREATLQNIEAELGIARSRRPADTDTRRGQ